jgi:RNA-binding protein Musashi
MESDQGKLFIGGISWETTEEKLSEHFSAYGEVTQAAVMRDKITGRPRGFGFVVFADPAVVDRALQDPHTLDGRTVWQPPPLRRRETLDRICKPARNIRFGRLLICLTVRA